MEHSPSDLPRVVLVNGWRGCGKTTALQKAIARYVSLNIGRTVIYYTGHYGLGIHDLFVESLLTELEHQDVVSYYRRSKKSIDVESKYGTRRSRIIVAREPHDIMQFGTPNDCLVAVDDIDVLLERRIAFKRDNHIDAFWKLRSGATFGRNFTGIATSSNPFISAALDGMQLPHIPYALPNTELYERLMNEHPLL